MRLIDADELMKKVKKWLPPDPCGREEKEFPFETDICVSMLMEIEEAPTVVELVRCKDCKFNNDCDIQFAAQAGNSFFLQLRQAEGVKHEKIHHCNHRIHPAHPRTVRMEKSRL